MRFSNIDDWIVRVNESNDDIKPITIECRKLKVIRQFRLLPHSKQLKQYSDMVDKLCFNIHNMLCSKLYPNRRKDSDAIAMIAMQSQLRNVEHRFNVSLWRIFS